MWKLGSEADDGQSVSRLALSGDAIGRRSVSAAPTEQQQQQQQPWLKCMSSRRHLLRNWQRWCGWQTLVTALPRRSSIWTELHVRQCSRHCRGTRSDSPSLPHSTAKLDSSFRRRSEVNHLYSYDSQYIIYVLYFVTNAAQQYSNYHTNTD